MGKVRRRQQGEGSLYQRGRDGRWVAVADLGWRNGARDRREFTSADMREAMAKRQAFLDRRRDGFTIPKGRQPYVSEWMLHWLHKVAKPKVEATTWEKTYRHKVEELICPFFERIPLPELTEEDIEDWHRFLQAKISKRTGRPLSNSTIHQAHRIMSRALKVAVVRGRIARNPCSNVTPPKITAIRARPPSSAEVQRILRRCQAWPNGARWILAIATGLRQGEALALEWRDVQLDAPASIRIDKSAAMIHGERIIKAPKSAKSTRTVGLPPAAVAALTRHRQSQSVAAINGLVFTDGKGQPVHPRADYGDWQALLADLGLPHYRVHDLRHETATMLLEGGVDARVVQEILGHASADFTRRAYQHVRPVLHEHATGVIEGILRGE
ncbi:MAG TPA: tyrosine-type recombinase/integrase [Streptosporangiaceae bacterium]|nr:tyrosine-type recombinase/integrase [Streptosporangiaceae bacterium]